MTIEQAIARSISHNEITHADATQDEIDDLCESADDYCDLTAQYGYWDVWGKQNGGEYRIYVHVTD
jgi:hypothetical protein